ncbi:MAG: MnhB domain-containing protein [Planctomycetota bacterium]
MFTSRILITVGQLVVPLGLVFAAYMTLRGHNAPGGGFIGGLAFAVAFILFRMAAGPDRFRAMIPLHPRLLLFSGMGIAFLTGVVPLLFNRGFLTSYVEYVAIPMNDPIHFASAVFFDAGVLMVVIGAVVGMIVRLSEELES